MQGEYNGKPIFRRRYVSMNEEAIREEINRLQDELYAMQEVLELFGKDNKDIRNQVQVGQESNERLLKALGKKVENLEEKIDYRTPLKAQLSETVEEFKEKINELYCENKKQGIEKSIKWLTILTIVNTVLLLGVIMLVGYSILFV
ncbi:hypothetical protein [Pseudobutyrivibrio sp.]|uniref:hypothetical protein n=1 Tax=Pseudobutyrivibrio sp. TaxID=2014367 RepID=UPI001B2AC4DF|nr:hypothetical protein [Pseudobutyrivibrio sp.]MBO5617335.1 hypothetical protein [Pseudobutyrivibrio sp.]MBP3261464.1 hypothetical protein [Pseudobutyrivibrio sp.]